MNFYNEIDPYAAEWIRNLIAAGEIPDGVVDERSICDIHPDELIGFTQVHLFAGIAGWSLALRIAGIPDDFPLWSGSCPCQPYSTAGSQKGSADERNLWPEMFRLVEGCRPGLIFGEQVAASTVVGSSSKAKRGDKKSPEQVWLDGVFSDLERASYACGAVDIPSAGVGAPHIRQRLYWMANASIESIQWNSGGFSASEAGISGEGKFYGHMPDGFEPDGAVSGLANAECPDARVREPGFEGRKRIGRDRFANDGDAGGMANGNRSGQQGTGSADVEAVLHRHRTRTIDSVGVGDAGRLANSPQQRSGPGADQSDQNCGSRELLAGTESRIDGRDDRDDVRMGVTNIAGLQQGIVASETNGQRSATDPASRIGKLGDTEGRGLGIDRSASGICGHAAQSDATGLWSRDVGVAHPDVAGPQGRLQREQCAGELPARSPGPWSSFTIIRTSDGKYRRVPATTKPQIQQMADGISVVLGQPCPTNYPLAEKTSQRVGRLKGYGNAINPHLAAEFILASFDAMRPARTPPRWTR